MTGAELERLRETVEALATMLGPVGSVPGPGIDRALVDLIEALEAVSKPPFS